jgi:hypothetical protein
MRKTSHGVRIALIVTGVVLISCAATITFIAVTIHSSSHDAAFSAADIDRSVLAATTTGWTRV